MKKLFLSLAFAGMAFCSNAQGGKYPIFGGDTTHLTIGGSACFIINGNPYPMNTAYMTVATKDTTQIGFYLVNTLSTTGAYQICKPKSYHAYYNDSTGAFFTSANAVWNFYRWHMVK